MSHTTTRRDALKLAALGPLAFAGAPSIAAAAAAAAPLPPAAASSGIRFAVSTYSYWHFQDQKYPVQKVIEQAAALGFDGVELLHRQMDGESPAYLNSLKQLAFKHGLSLPMLSICLLYTSPSPRD